ncbi:MAG: DUF2794 domain-containing protein [Alphaproteobacteria bacterium]
MKANIFFDRAELNRILGLYGRMVSAGEWRDYALDALEDRAVFSIYRRSSESPLFQVVKRPKDFRKQGMYSVVSSAGAVLRRGPDLERVLGVMEPQRLRLIGADWTLKQA